MIKISSENSNMLKNIFEDKSNAPMINDLVSKVLGLKVKETEFDSIKKFETISEYEFSLIKAICNLEMDDNIEVYFKVIKKDIISNKKSNSRKIFFREFLCPVQFFPFKLLPNTSETSEIVINAEGSIAFTIILSFAI